MGDDAVRGRPGGSIRALLRRAGGVSSRFPDRELIARCAVWIVPTALLFALYWGIARVDNDMVIREGDMTTIFGHTCDIFRIGVQRLFVAHADHIIATYYALNVPLILLFGNSYVGYAAVSILFFGLSLSAGGALVRAVTGSLTAAMTIMVLLCFGWWVARGVTINAGHTAYSMVVLFTCLAGLRIIDLKERRSAADIAIVTALCLASSLTILAGGLAFVFVGVIASLHWLYFAVRQSKERGGISLPMPDWRFALALFAGAGLVFLAYVIGHTVVGNPAVGTMSFGRSEVEYSLVRRTLTALRAEVSNIFGPNEVGDGLMGDNFYVVGGKWGTVAPQTWLLATVVVASAIALYVRGLRTGSAFAARIGAVAIAAIAAGVIVTIATLMARAEVPLSATRYIHLPIVLFAVAMGLPLGWLIMAAPRRLQKWVIRVELLTVVVILSVNQQAFLRTDMPNVQGLISHLEGRPIVDWWSTCPLAIRRVDVPAF